MTVIIRGKGALGIGAALDLHVALDAERDDRIRVATERVDADINERKARVRDRVPADMRRHFDAQVRAWDEQRKADAANGEPAGVALVDELHRDRFATGDGYVIEEAERDG